MNPTPDYSARMLRVFLVARSHAIEGFEGRAMVAKLSADLEAKTGLAASTIADAFAGRLTDGPARAAIWAVLGHFPADRNLILTDDGGQRHA